MNYKGFELIRIGEMYFALHLYSNYQFFIIDHNKFEECVNNFYKNMIFENGDYTGYLTYEDEKIFMNIYEIERIVRKVPITCDLENQFNLAVEEIKLQRKIVLEYNKLRNIMRYIYCCYNNNTVTLKINNNDLNKLAIMNFISAFEKIEITSAVNGDNLGIKIIIIKQ